MQVRPRKTVLCHRELEGFNRGQLSLVSFEMCANKLTVIAHIVFSGRFHSVIDVVYRNTLLLHNSRHRVLVDCKKKAMYSLTVAV